MDFQDLVYLAVFIWWLLSFLGKRTPSVWRKDVPPALPVGLPSSQELSETQTGLAEETKSPEDEPERAKIAARVLTTLANEETLLRAPAKVTKTPGVPASVRCPAISRRVAESLLLGDILLKPRSRAR